ncbi:TonB-dependent siderophore receptor [Gloeocapsa sp. BRSZ]
MSPNTSLNFNAKFIPTQRETIDNGLPVIGDRPADLPRDRFLDEPFTEQTLDAFSLGYTLDHRFNQNWSVRHVSQFVRQTDTRLFTAFDALDETTGELARERRFIDGDYQRFQTNTDLIGEFTTGSIQHRLLFGIEYYSGFEDPLYQSVPYPSINIFNPVYTRQRFAWEPDFFRDDHYSGVGIYLQDQIDLLPNLKLLAGLRFDSAYQFASEQDAGQPRNDFEQTDSAWTPRVGIVYQPIEPLSLYASYTRSFNPTFPSFRNADGTPFKPETGRQFEVGLKADLSDQLSLTLAAFDLRKQNVVTADPNDSLFSIQVGEQTSRGIELSLDGEILPSWNITASYAYLDAFVSEDNTLPVGNRLANIPYNQLSLWTTYSIEDGDFEGLGFGLGLFYVGDIDDTFRLPRYFRTDAALFYRRDNWQMQLNVQNLFDVEYFTSANYGSRTGGVNVGAPFTVQGTISVQF